jgi:beta-N-acetylhexosaminidase
MPYKNAINNNVEGIMTSHVLYRNIDKYPPTISQKWLKLLRNDLRYKGLIFSDDLSMKALQKFGDIGDNLLKSIEAGCDCIFICNNRNKVVNIIDNFKINIDEVISNKIMKLNKKNTVDDFNKNKKRIKIKEMLTKIQEKKQIEIKL